MKTVCIHKPIWSSRSIGVAEYRLEKDVKVEIDYETADGIRMFPHKYLLPREKAMTYPTQVVRGGTVLRIIPIADLEICKPRKKKEKKDGDNPVQ